MLLHNRGRKLLIRQSGPEDAEFLHQAYRDDAFMRLYRSNWRPGSVEDLREELRQRAEGDPAGIGHVEFVIVHERHGPIGVTALTEYSPVHRRGEFLIGIVDEARRNEGHGIEATLLVLDLAFNHYGLNKVYAYAYEYNTASHANMLKLGFVHEATLKQHHYLVGEGRFVGLIIDSIVLEDFRSHERIARLSRRLVGQDITIQPTAVRLTARNELPAAQGALIAQALRSLRPFTA